MSGQSSYYGRGKRPCIPSPMYQYGGRGRDIPTSLGGRGSDVPGRDMPTSLGGRGSDMPTSLLARNLDPDWSSEDLRGPFERFGTLMDIYLPTNYYTGKRRGIGFVQYLDPADAANAKCHMDGYVLLGKELTVVFATEDRKTPSEMRARKRVRDQSCDRRRPRLGYSDHHVIYGECCYSHSPDYYSSSTRQGVSPRLAGKVVIITGGVHGSGATMVRLFHQHGAKVLIADMQYDLGQAIVEELGENVRHCCCDVTNEEEISKLMDTTIAEHGKLDIMFINSCMVDPPVGGILCTSKSDLQRVINVNAIGAFVAGKCAARYMEPQRKGSIIFTASACTSIAGLPAPAYALSNDVLLLLVKRLAAEVEGFGIRVSFINGIQGLNEVEEAKADEAMIAMGNLKRQVPGAGGVAQAALYMASDEANSLSGLNLVVEGALSIVNPPHNGP